MSYMNHFHAYIAYSIRIAYSIYFTIFKIRQKLCYSKLSILFGDDIFCLNF